MSTTSDDKQTNLKLYLLLITSHQRAAEKTNDYDFHSITVQVQPLVPGVRYRRVL